MHMLLCWPPGLMWDTWDVALESILSQLPEMAGNPSYQYRPTTFFSDQLTSFEIWIEFGSEKDPPGALPGRWRERTLVGFPCLFLHWAA